MPDVDPEILVLYRSLDLGGVLLMSIMGGTIARQRHFDVMGFLFLALFSSLGGGMIRDIAIGQVPSVFSGGKLYATPALISAAMMVAFHVADYSAAGMIILSFWRGWALPIDPDFAPVNKTVSHFGVALQRAQRRARKIARRRGGERDTNKHSSDLPDGV